MAPAVLSANVQLNRREKAVILCPIFEVPVFVPLFFSVIRHVADIPRLDVLPYNIHTASERCLRRAGLQQRAGVSMLSPG